MELKRLTEKDYDELLTMLNYVFSHKYGRPTDFERELPKMWVRDEESMSKHIGVWEDGRLCSVVGVYPLPAKVAGIPCLFATTGNVATLPEYEGRGFMSTAFAQAMEAVGKMGVDAARLGGNRQRYARFGFEGCGTVYNFCFEQSDRVRFFKEYAGGISFREIQETDVEILDFCNKLSRTRMFYVERSTEHDYREVYRAMCGKVKTPYIAFQDGLPIGYLCASDKNGDIGELKAVTIDALKDMICAWQEKWDKMIRFPIAPYMTEELRLFVQGADTYGITYPSRFRIMNWVKLVDAFMKLKASYEQMPEGELVIEIVDYGCLNIYVRGGEAGCEFTAKNAKLRLDSLAASRLIFGPMPPLEITDAAPLLRAWFPLPLTWDFLDAV